MIQYESEVVDYPVSWFGTRDWNKYSYIIMKKWVLTINLQTMSKQEHRLAVASVRVKLEVKKLVANSITKVIRAPHAMIQNIYQLVNAANKITHQLSNNVMTTYRMKMIGSKKPKLVEQ